MHDLYKYSNTLEMDGERGREKKTMERYGKEKRRTNKRIIKDKTIVAELTTAVFVT